MPVSIIFPLLFQLLLHHLYLFLQFLNRPIHVSLLLLEVFNLKQTLCVVVLDEFLEELTFQLQLLRVNLHFVQLLDKHLV